MKALLTLFFVCFLSQGICKPGTYASLTAVNACWAEQPGSIAGQLPAWQERTNAGWIQLHLSLVEKILRNRNSGTWTPAQKERRLRSLDDLHHYWMAGRFPLNKQYAYKTPIFIDADDNFCAVGYLIKASGHEAIARKIAAQTNLAYVREMHDPELDRWAAQYGFTRDELAWIQPGYLPLESTIPIGKGVNGTVHELFPDGDTLYVGGRFSMADSTIPAVNIAYVTENGGTYTWHAMGTGVNGTVKAIEKYRGRIYIAGHFSMAGDSVVHNVAYWENGRWRSIGCTYGEISDLRAYNGELYAAGHFDVCAALSDLNFAHLNGSTWQQVMGLTGRVNTLEVMDSVLLLGGAFSYNGQQMGAIKWSAAGFTPFAGATKNEINDFEWYNQKMYAAGNYLPGGDSLHLCYTISNGRMDSLNGYFPAYADGAKPKLLCLAAKNYSLMLGGKFYSGGMIYTENCLSLTPYSGAGMGGNWFTTNDTICKMVYYKGDLIAGGSFTATSSFQTSVRLNGICKRINETNAVPGIPGVTDQLTLYPNPVRNARLTIENNFNASRFYLQDLHGRKLGEGSLQAAGSQEISLPSLAPGVYFLNVSNGRGASVTRKVVIPD